MGRLSNGGRDNTKGERQEKEKKEKTNLNLVVSGHFSCCHCSTICVRGGWRQHFSFWYDASCYCKGSMKYEYRKNVWDCVLTGGAGAGDTGGVTAWRWGVRPRGVLLSIPLNPSFIVSADPCPLLAAVQVAEGDPCIQDVIERDLCWERTWLF